MDEEGAAAEDDEPRRGEDAGAEDEHVKSSSYSRATARSPSILSVVRKLHGPALVSAISLSESEVAVVFSSSATSSVRFALTL